MAVRLQCLCEICLDDGREVDASPIYLKVGDVGGLIDLCDEHSELIFKPLYALVKDHSRPAGDDAPKPVQRPAAAGAGAVLKASTVSRASETWPCPACPERTPFGSVAGLTYHAEHVHKIKLREINALTSQRCRMPDCDWTNITGAASITSHLRFAHKIPNAPMMTAYLAATDPERVEDIMDLWFRSALADV